MEAPNQARNYQSKELLIFGMTNQLTWPELDAAYHWHPYTQHHQLGALPVIKKGHKALLYDVDGKTYIDAISSWWACPYGHTHPKLIKSLNKQAKKLEHVLFGGFSHIAAIELSDMLLNILPSNQKKIFFSDNGSTAVEVALKACFQYYVNADKPRSKILALQDAFHGDTFGAMAASGIGLFNEAFKNQMLAVDRINIFDEDAVNQAKELLETNQYAAFIFEPLVQGAAGMKFYDTEKLNDIMAIAKKQGTFCIADEVMTGFGKTGKNFASDYLAHQPDAMCFSKGLTGGMLPMAITSFSQTIFDGFLSNDINKALMHGHTFTANPLGCAVAKASIKILGDKQTQKQIKKINQRHLAFVNIIKNHSLVENIRVLGVILAFEIKSENTEYYGALRQKMYNFFIENGILLRPVGNTIYVMPPYVISKTELQKVYDVIMKLLEFLQKN